MYIQFKDGFCVHFTKNENTYKNEIVVIYDGRFYGSLKNVNRDWGNYWFKSMQKNKMYNGETMVDYMFLDNCAFHDDYDGYSDTYKDIHKVRPHYTQEEWDKKVNEAKNRKP